MKLELLIPIVAILMPLFLVPTIIRMKHNARRRELEYRERLRALELGVAPLEPNQPVSSFWPSLAAIAIGAGVPISALVIAWQASVKSGAGLEVWICAGVVGVTAILGGTALAFRLAGSTPWLSDWLTDCSSHHAKPAHFDPDAYDTVSSRG